jgi:uncharacterized membrane protein
MLRGDVGMSKIIVGVFESREYAEKAAKQIENQGMSIEDLSIVAKHDDNHEAGVPAEVDGRPRNDNISDGVIGGGIVGGIAGLLLGMGTIAIPGLGIIAAAGPIAGMLSGVVTGGIVGGLIDLGIPEEESRRYESDIKEGKILLSMRAEDDRIDQLESILTSNGAVSVDIH